MLRRISKADAKKRFTKGESIVLCPCKFYPTGGFSMGATISSKKWMEKGESYINHPDLWKGSVEKTAWDLMYNNWSYYNNLGNEVGRYAHYYTES